MTARAEHGGRTGWLSNGLAIREYLMGRQISSRRAGKEPTAVATETFSHFGICVADLDQSLTFYREALGFTLTESHTVGNEFARLMEVDDVLLQSRFLRRDGVSLELLHFDSPGQSGAPVRRRMNALGLTHLSFRVHDCDAVAARIVAYGGAVLEHTRTTIDGGDGPALDFVYCTDPNGVRIELMNLPG
jgi:predicted enzyme related to lactoylglutathione lyase